MQQEDETDQPAKHAMRILKPENGFEFTKDARVPDPYRMNRAYMQSAATLNLLRAFSQGGYADLHQIHKWNLDFVKNTPQNNHYESIASRITPRGVT